MKKTVMSQHEAITLFVELSRYNLIINPVFVWFFFLRMAAMHFHKNPSQPLLIQNKMSPFYSIPVTLLFSLVPLVPLLQLNGFSSLSGVEGVNRGQGSSDLKHLQL